MNKAYFYYSVNGELTREVVTLVEYSENKSLIVDSENTLMNVSNETLKLI